MDQSFGSSPRCVQYGESMQEMMSQLEIGLMEVDVDEEIMQLLQEEAEDFAACLEEDAGDLNPFQQQDPNRGGPHQDQQSLDSSILSSPIPTKKSSTCKRKRNGRRSEVYDLLKEVEALKLKADQVQHKRRPNGCPPSVASMASSTGGYGQAAGLSSSQQDDIVATSDSNGLSVMITKQRSFWQQVAEKERNQREIAEKSNGELKGFLQQQHEMVHMMHQLGLSLDDLPDPGSGSNAVSSNDLNGVSHDFNASTMSQQLNQQEFMASAAYQQQQQLQFALLEQQLQQQAQQHGLTHPITRNSIMAKVNDPHRLHWLLRRLEFSLQQTDLVFQQRGLLSSQLQFYLMVQPDAFIHSRHAMNQQFMASIDRVIPRPVLQASNVDDLISFHENFAELSGCRVVPFNASHFLDLVWRCFVWHSTRTNVPGRPNTLHHAYQQCVLDNVIHGQSRFSVRICSSPVHIETHNALKKSSNLVVCETVGVVARDQVQQSYLPDQSTSGGEGSVCELTQLEFTRSSWCHVQELPDGRCVVRHVSRMAPVAGSAASASACASASPQEAERLHSERLKLMGRLILQSHAETGEYFSQLLGRQVVEQFTNTVTPLQ